MFCQEIPALARLAAVLLACVLGAGTTAAETPPPAPAEASPALADNANDQETMETMMKKTREREKAMAQEGEKDSRRLGNDQGTIGFSRRNDDSSDPLQLAKEIYQDEIDLSRYIDDSSFPVPLLRYPSEAVPFIYGDTSTDSLPRATPEAEWLSSAALAAAVKKLTELEYVHGFVILHNGYVIAEGHRAPWRADLPHMLFSASKSFTAVAVGLAEADGRLALDDPLVKFFPEIVNDNPKVDAAMRRVTLRHLLTMASGHDHCLMTEMMAAPDGDYARVFLETAPKYAPGTRFVYNSGASYMLAAVVRRATGQNVGDYLAPRLFKPLGIADWRWDKCPQGTDLGGYGLYLRTEDLAKFAELMRHKGVWGTRQLHVFGQRGPNAWAFGSRLLPGEFLAEATRKQIDTGNGGGYGYQFWTGPDGSFQASGMCGQFALVLPEAEMAIGVTAGLADMDELLQRLRGLAVDVEEASYSSVVPSPRSPAAKAGQAELRRVCSGLTLPVAQGDLARRDGAGRYVFGKGAPQETTIDLGYEGDVLRLRFANARETAELRAGFGHWGPEAKMTPDPRTPPLRVVASAAWTAPDTLEVACCWIETPFVTRHRFRFAGAGAHWEVVAPPYYPGPSPLLSLDGAKEK